MSSPSGDSVDLSTIAPRNEVFEFCHRCMVKAGATEEDARNLAEVLTEADYRGHYSHGLNRLGMYVRDVKSKACCVGAIPEVLKESVSTAWVDGKNALGPTVGNFCMDLAVKKAKETGIAFVVAKGSNHYGIAGWYTIRALNAGMIGFSCTNTSPLMTPTRAKSAVLGTNPISLAAPATNGDSFILDMATTAVALGKIEVARKKRQSIPDGWAVDREGKNTNDPNQDVFCMPLGGAEITGGYKGYGLALMVEILTGVLSGGAMGPWVRGWMNTDRVADLGQCFLAIDPSRFTPGFESRASKILNYYRHMESVDPLKSVLVPGDPEHMHMDAVDKLGGIPYHRSQIESCYQIAQELGIEPLKTVG